MITGTEQQDLSRKCSYSDYITWKTKELDELLGGLGREKVTSSACLTSKNVFKCIASAFQRDAKI